MRKYKPNKRATQRSVFEGISAEMSETKVEKAAETLRQCRRSYH